MLKSTGHMAKTMQYYGTTKYKKIAASLFATVIFYQERFCYKQHEKSYDNTYFTVAKLCV